MRKRNPNGVVDQFQDELARSLADWATLIAGVSAMPARRATMDAFNRAAVAFERFRSDWQIAAITRDASRFASSRRERLERTLSGNGERNLLPYVHLAVPAHPTLEQVADLLDATGGNVAIPNIDRWRELASRDLADSWRAKVAEISWADAKAAAAVIAIRNAAAHQSPRSLAAMSDALPSLPSSCETLMTTFLLTLRARSGACWDVAEQVEWGRRSVAGASRRRAQAIDRRARRAGPRAR